MSYLLPLSSFILFFGAGLGATSLILASRRRNTPGRMAFLLLAAAVTIWAFCDGLTGLLSDPSARILCARISYLGVATVPTLTFTFSLRYTRQTRFLEKPWHIALLWFIPVLTFIMAWTNDRHLLLWAQVTPIPYGLGLAFTYGPYFWVYICYSYLLLIIAFGALLSAIVRYPHLYRSQATAILSGALVPWIGNVLYLALDNPFPGFDPTSLGFAISAVIYSLALFRFELFNLTPVARDILVESMSDAVLVLDSTCRVVDTNPAARQALFARTGKVIGQAVEALLPLPAPFLDLIDTHRGQSGRAAPVVVVMPTRRQILLRQLRALWKPEHPLAKDLPQMIDLEINYSEDPLVVLEMRISPVSNYHGEHTGWLVVLRNVTERRRMEMELRQARDTAEAASRFKSEFLANMSHEIRTPMNAVIGMTTLLMDTPLDDEQRDWLDIVRNSSESLLSVINDILDYSRVESGKLTLEQTPFSLRATVEESLDVVAVRAVEKNLELLYQVDEHTPDLLVGDANRLRQVLVNLLNNAVKFTEIGQVVLTIHSGAGLKIATDPGSEAQDWMEMRFAVKDSGIGISADKLDRLFQPFSQLHSTSNYGGSGLGLAISKRLVEMMGGRIWVESEPGLGSNFSFTIWAQLKESRRQPPPLPEALLGRRILVIEPHMIGRQILIDLIERAGMAVLAAGSTSEALALVKPAGESRAGANPRGKGGRSPFTALLEPVARQTRSALTGGDTREPRRIDVVLVDRRASDVNQINQALPGVPVVMMAPPGASSGGTGALVRARLLKPVRPSRLYQILARCLQTPSGEPWADGAEDLSGNEGRQGRIPASAEMPTRPRPLPSPSPLRILVAEDNPTNQRVIQLILNQLGYPSELAGDGLQVMAALSRKIYDVVLMDMQMPGLDGLETTHMIRENLPETRQPCIIAMTANAMQGDRDRCLAAGMNDYLSKPVRNSELARALLAVQRLNTQPGPSTAEAGDAPERFIAVRDDIFGPDDVLPLTDAQPPAESPQAETGADPLHTIRAEIAGQAVESNPAPAAKDLPAAVEPAVLPEPQVLTEIATAQAAPAPDALANAAEPEPAPLAEDSPQDEVIDRELLDNMITFLGNEGSQLVNDVVRLFAQTTPEILQQMDSAVQRGDLLAVQQSAHSLKSSSASLGAVRLSRFASQMELSARDMRETPIQTAVGQTPGLPQFEVMLDQLRAEFNRAYAEMKDMGY